MVYADTSLLVPAFTVETGREDAIRWLEPHEIVISDWTIAEFTCALGRKRWAGDIDPATHSRVMSAFDRLVESVDPLDVERRHFHRAAAFTRDGRLTLRAGDALHLAIASAGEFTVATLDDDMTSAAAMLGIGCLRPDLGG